MITPGEQQYFIEQFSKIGVPIKVVNDFDLDISSGKKYNKLSWVCLDYCGGKLSGNEAISKITKIYENDINEEEEFKGIAKTINSLKETEIWNAFIF
jgi:hypothetical protein